MKALVIILILGCFGCNKLLEIPTPENIIPGSQVFISDSSVNSAIVGIYNKWKALYNNYNSPSIIGGLSADELINESQDPLFEQFETNTLSSQNSYLPWSDLYNIIYQANSCIEGISKADNMTKAARDYFTGEAKFIRAYSYFTLVNFFGNVPLLVTTDVEVNRLASRSSVDSVYNQIIIDLLDSKLLLESDLFGELYKYRINKWAASAFLARVYLFRENWAECEENSSEIISSNKFSLVNDIDSITIGDNIESVFQFNYNDGDANFEASAFITEEAPFIVAKADFVASFSDDDVRKQKWMLSKVYFGDVYYFPYKYKNTEFLDNERYTLLRLAEQYLIRAEANANLNRINKAVDDLNIIRERAGLSLIDNNIGKDSCVKLVINERRHELFAETSHRWFDLKRHKIISQVLLPLKGSVWQASDIVYPLPYTDVQRNPNLVQNPEY